VRKRWYDKRDAVLKRLGYDSYKDYLKSPGWKKIRTRVLSRCQGKCEVCGVNKPTQVHHRSYCMMTMLGKRLEFLVGCCRNCHENAEFEETRKVSPYRANTRMGADAHRRGRVLFGICRVCRKNPTAKKKTICGRCKRDRATKVP
jgi:hypothetical protein